MSHYGHCLDPKCHYASGEVIETGDLVETVDFGSGAPVAAGTDFIKPTLRTGIVFQVNTIHNGREYKNFCTILTDSITNQLCVWKADVKLIAKRNLDGF